MKNIGLMLATLAIVTGCSSMGGTSNSSLCQQAHTYPLDLNIINEISARKLSCHPISEICDKYSKDEKKMDECLHSNYARWVAEGKNKAAPSGKVQPYTVISEPEFKRRRMFAPLPYSGFPGAVGSGQTVYAPSQCTGPIVAGTCHGGIIPNPSLQKTCHGEMLPNGQCTGPMF